MWNVSKYAVRTLIVYTLLPALTVFLLKYVKNPKTVKECTLLIYIQLTYRSFCLNVTHLMVVNNSINVFLNYILLPESRLVKVANRGNSHSRLLRKYILEVVFVTKTVTVVRVNVGCIAY